MEKVAVRWSRVAMSVVHACPIGKATSSTLPQYFLRVVIRGEYLLVFFASLMSQPMSLHKSISMMIMVQFSLLKEFGFGEGESGTPLAKIKSRAVPCLAKKSSRVFSIGRTHLGIRRGAVVDSASPAAAERPRRLYMGSWETSVCLLRRMSSVVGKGASQSSGRFASRGAGLLSSWADDEDSGVGERNSRVSFVVWGCEPVSAAIRT